MTVAHRTKTVLIVVFTILLMLLLTSCSQAPQAQSASARPVTDAQIERGIVDGQPGPTDEAPANLGANAIVDEHGLHVIRNQRLRDIMHRLSGMDFESISNEIAMTGAVHSDICEVSRLATELASDAQVIPLIFRDTEMQDESRRVLDTMARRLHDEALELRRFADANNVTLVKTKIDDMIATCNACHSSFRAPAVVQVDWGEAADGEVDRLLADAIGLAPD